MWPIGSSTWTCSTSCRSRTSKRRNLPLPPDSWSVGTGIIIEQHDETGRHSKVLEKPTVSAVSPDTFRRTDLRRHTSRIGTCGSQLGRDWPGSAWRSRRRGRSCRHPIPAPHHANREPGNGASFRFLLSLESKAWRRPARKSKKRRPDWFPAFALQECWRRSILTRRKLEHKITGSPRQPSRDWTPNLSSRGSGNRR